jgi:uncharacterized membrane protein YtjA (UPF0391 family)
VLQSSSWRGKAGFGSLSICIFSPCSAREPAGTFAPAPDYFRDRGAALTVARIFKPESKTKKTKGCVMLGWVVTFLIIALIAGILGFGGVAGASIEIAKFIFFIAVVLFLVSAVVGLARGRTRV